jgi:hypothetical protein
MNYNIELKEECNLSINKYFLHIDRYSYIGKIGRPSVVFVQWFSRPLPSYDDFHKIKERMVNTMSNIDEDKSRAIITMNKNDKPVADLTTKT